MIGIISTICAGVAGLTLQFASDQQIEALIGAPQLNIGVQHDRVVTLRQRIEHFVQRDGLLGLEAFVKIIAFQHLRDGEFRGQADDAFKAKLAQPLGVVADLCFFTIENLEHLIGVGLGILVDFFAGQRLASDGAAGGIANQAGEVANQEDDGVARGLENVSACESERCGRDEDRAQWDRSRL